MDYPFDTVVNRRNTDCIKWDDIQRRYRVSGEDLLPFWVADMEFRPPEAVVEAMVRRARHGICGYPAGLDGYHAAIRGWLLRRHGWEIQEDWILSTPGVVSAVNLLIRTLTTPGDGVVLQPPVYYPFFRGVEENGCRLVENPLRFDGRRYRMDFDDLRAKLRQAKLLILCSPHNPVGRVWTLEEIMTLACLCLESGVLVISDEIHFDLVFSGHAHTVFASLSEELAQRSVVCTSPSKSFNLPGLHPGMVFIPNPQLRGEFQHTLRACGLPGPNVFSLEAVKAAYDHGEPWLKELLTYLEQNAAVLERAVAEEMPRLHLVRPEGTYLAWLDCRELGMDPPSLERWLLEEVRLVLNQGYTFGSGGEGFVRINFACPRAMLEEGLARLARAVRAL